MKFAYQCWFLYHDVRHHTWKIKFFRDLFGDSHIVGDFRYVSLNLYWSWVSMVLIRLCRTVRARESTHLPKTWLLELISVFSIDLVVLFLVVLQQCCTVAVALLTLVKIIPLSHFYILAFFVFWNLNLWFLFLALCASDGQDLGESRLILLPRQSAV